MSLEQNLEYAKYGLDKCDERFPLGGLNRKDVYDKLMNLSKEKLQRQLRLRGLYRANSMVEMVNAPETYTTVAFSDELQGGYCGDLANYARHKIAKKYPDVNVEVVQIGDHELVMVGRKKESDPTDIKTWGIDAAFCDPWAKKIYAIVELSTIRQQADIPSYRIDDDFNAVLCKEHYLTGKPIIVDAYLSVAKINQVRGVTALKSKEYSEALECFRKAISYYEKTIHEVTGENMECLTHITTCLYALNKFFEARESCQQAKALYEAALIKAPDFRYTEAIVTLERVLADLNKKIAASTSQANLIKNLEYAEYGLKKCREKFPLGALNRKENFESLMATSTDLFNLQLMLLKKYRDICIAEVVHEKLTPEQEAERLQAFQLLKGGFCGDLTQFTIAIIGEKFDNEVTVELVQTTDHELMVIGRNPTSDKGDIATWGNSAVLCDAWAELIYPVAEFFKHQNGKTIPYYHTNPADFGKLCNDHYLIGKPVVVDNSYVPGQRLYNEGREYFLKNDFDTAIKLFLRSKAILEKLSYAKIDLAMCCTDLSTCYIELQQFRLGVDAYRIVVNCFESEYGLLDDKTQEAKANLKKIQRVVDIQAPQLLFAAKIESAAGAKKIYATALTQIKKNEFANAITTLNNSLAQFKKLSNFEEEQGMCYSALASCYRGLEDYSQAKEMAEAAVNLLETKLGSDNAKTLSAKTKLTGIEQLLTEKSNARRLG